jgi:ABC-2 type transport system permease protein
MWSIYLKETKKLFSSLTGYIAILVFLLVCGIFLFVLPKSGILDNNYAQLDAFFELAPWVLLFLIPAVTMHSFADEFKTGTFEILKTKPLTNWQIILGKYFAILAVLLLVIISTITYAVTIKTLSASGNIDTGAIIGSYIGLFFLGASFAAISICCSAFTNNAVVAFLISTVSCIVLYFGFSAVSKLPFLSNGPDYFIDMLGIDFHYKNISLGVIDSVDIVYFVSIIFLALFITKQKIGQKK